MLTIGGAATAFPFPQRLLRHSHLVGYEVCSTVGVGCPKYAVCNISSKPDGRMTANSCTSRINAGGCIARLCVPCGVVDFFRQLLQNPLALRYFLVALVLRFIIQFEVV